LFYQLSSHRTGWLQNLLNILGICDTGFYVFGKADSIFFYQQYSKFQLFYIKLIVFGLF